MNKNIIIGVVVVVIILVGAFFTIFRGKPPIETAIFDKDETELGAFGSDVALFEQDNTIFDELNQTFSDILEEGAVVSTEASIDLTSLNKEASGADFSGDLDVFNEGVLQELDQVLGEVSQ